MPNISAELKNQLATEVDAAVQKLNELKAKIQSAAGAEQVKALAKEVKDLFKSTHDIVKKIVDAIHASRANEAAAKTESAYRQEKIGRIPG